MQNFRFVLGCQIHGKEYSIDTKILLLRACTPVNTKNQSCVAVFGVYLKIGKQSILQPTHFRKDLEKYLSENVWVVALIVYLFRDKRQKHQRN